MLWCRRTLPNHPRRPLRGPRHGWPEGGGGWEMDISDPPWAQANFPPPQRGDAPCIACVLGGTSPALDPPQPQPNAECHDQRPPHCATVDGNGLVLWEHVSWGFQRPRCFIFPLSPRLDWSAPVCSCTLQISPGLSL